MIKSKNLIMIGAGWSVLVLSVLLLLEPVARSGTIVSALLLLVVGWLIAASIAASSLSD